MTDPVVQIGADGVDVNRIMDDIRATVARKMEAGVYRDARVAAAEKTNLASLRDDAKFVRFYLDCLRQSVTVDINDFEIQERRPRVGWLARLLKTIIWKLLKFYTYRLWSQQNEVNSLLVTAIEGVDEKYQHRIQDLERRLQALEHGKAASPCPPPRA